MVRRSILVGVALALMMAISQPASAKERDLGKLGPESDKLVGLCNEHDGTAWATPDGANWGCGYEGGGGVICDKDTGCLETTPERGAPDSRWGLLGLVGLVGLFGLRRRE